MWLADNSECPPSLPAPLQQLVLHLSPSVFSRFRSWSGLRISIRSASHLSLETTCSSAPLISIFSSFIGFFPVAEKSAKQGPLSALQTHPSPIFLSPIADPLFPPFVDFRFSPLIKPPEKRESTRLLALQPHPYQPLSCSNPNKSHPIGLRISSAGLNAQVQLTLVA